jgi:hypothetical protein
MMNDTQKAIQEKRTSVDSWRERAVRANRRVDEGRYEYVEAQFEEDGLSAASIDDEWGLQLSELDRMYLTEESK